jgi:hypothetical protein
LGVNLIALVSRLLRIWWRRVGSPRIWGHVGRDREAQREVALADLDFGHLAQVVDQIGQAQRDMFEPDALVVELGGVEHVVDDPQQGLAGHFDLVDQIGLRGIERGVAQQVGDADHGVERGADLVAHVGEELGLGAHRAFGALGGGAQRFLVVEAH